VLHCAVHVAGSGWSAATQIVPPHAKRQATTSDPISAGLGYLCMTVRELVPAARFPERLLWPAGPPTRVATALRPGRGLLRVGALLATIVLAQAGFPARL